MTFVNSDYLLYSRFGNLERVQQCLERGANPEATVNKQTALHLACLAQAKPLIQFLIKTCPKLVNIEDALKRTPLAYLFGIGSYSCPVKKADPDIYELFAQAKADIAHKDPCDETILHYCARAEENNELLPRILQCLDERVSESVKGVLGEPLGGPSFAIERTKKHELLNTQSSASICTPLEEAIRCDNIKAVKLFSEDTDLSLEGVCGKSLKEELDEFNRKHAAKPSDLEQKEDQY